MALGAVLSFVALASGQVTSAPMLFGAASALGGGALLLAGLAGRAPQEARMAALVVELSAVALTPHLIDAGQLAAPAWWSAGWPLFAVVFSLAINGTTATPAVAFSGALVGAFAGWQSGYALPAVVVGAAAIAPAWAMLPLWRQAARAHALPAGLASAHPSRQSGVDRPDPADATPFGESDLHAAAAMIGKPSVALLIHDSGRRTRLPWGDLHVLHAGRYEVHRVQLTGTDGRGDGELGCVPPLSVRLPQPYRVTRLNGQAGALGRVIVGDWSQNGAGGGESPETLLELLAAWWSLRLDNRRLAAEAQARLLDIVESLITSVEAKDPYTSGHSKRVCQYSELFARAMGISGWELEEIAIGAALHDVGKLGIPESVLRKPTKLSAEEWEQMKSHPRVGTQIIDSFNQSQAVLDMIFYHHEHFNGRGYPAGLAGEAIPLTARIVAVADALDAMTSARTYQRNRTVAQALEEIKANSGKQFDPQVVQAVLNVPLTVLEVIAPRGAAEPSAPAPDESEPAAPQAAPPAPLPAPVLPAPVLPSDEAPPALPPVERVPAIA